MKTAPYWFPGISADVEVFKRLFGEPTLIDPEWTLYCRPKEDCVINDMLFLKSDIYPFNYDQEDGKFVVVGMTGVIVRGMFYMREESFNEYFQRIEEL